MLAGGLTLLIPAVGGCDRQTTPSRYSVVLGDVTACQNDIGEITVAVVRRGGQEATGETLHCTVTGDSEIYVDDRLGTLNDVQPGVRVELIGYRDPNPAIDRFTVTFATIAHAHAPPDPKE
jgi:hypothetical protein